VSAATYWEIAIKIALRKYALPEPFVEQTPIVSDDTAFDAYPVTRLWSPRAATGCTHTSPGQSLASVVRPSTCLAAQEALPHVSCQQWCAV
jgi:hypothetical protein